METGYIPALRYPALTAWYDSVMRWTMRESAFKSQLVQQAHIQPKQRVLDLGCGTGTLTLLTKARHPEADVIGIDADPKALGLARAKCGRLGLQVRFAQGMCFELPFADASFDRILSSLLFHHLNREAKVRTLKEAARVLRPDGELHIADWGRPQNPLFRMAFLSVRLLDGFESTSDSVSGLLPGLIGNAGFGNPVESASFATIFGTLRLYNAKRNLGF